MTVLTSRERLLRTFEGKEIDRIPTFDIIHNIDLIEYLTDEKVTPKNAEDLLCIAASKILDLIRHFAVPNYFDTKIVKDEDGFVYKYEWWSGHIIERPKFDSTQDIARMIEKDISKILKCTEKKEICDIAHLHVNLFQEKFKTFEEVKVEYKRISNKLNGTIMLAPEGTAGIQIPQERYDYKWWVYFYNDFPEMAITYLDALVDYEIAFIDSFADFEMCPIAMSSGPIGTNEGLLYSADFFREVVIPRKKKTINKWRSYGIHHISFLDGYKWPVIGDFIGLGTEAICPFEPYAHMEVKKFREIYPEIVICQPIDCTQLLPFGSEEEIKQAVIKAIEDADKRKIIIGSTSEIHPKVNFRNALIMYETAKNYKL